MGQFGAYSEPGYAIVTDLVKAIHKDQGMNEVQGGPADRQDHGDGGRGSGEGAPDSGAEGGGGTGCGGRNDRINCTSMYQYVAK